jgi:microcystin-dependent protein
MAEPFLGELRLMSFDFAPKGWAQCNGQLLPINTNQGLFSLLGTTFGGDGRVNFALPDLRGRVPTHVGDEIQLGMRTGAPAHTLSTAELPTHVHVLHASGQPGDQAQPSLLGGANNVYGAPRDLTALHAQTIASVGGSQAHTNMQPSLTLTWCIAVTQGIFPSQT